MASRNRTGVFVSHSQNAGTTQVEYQVLQPIAQQPVIPPLSKTRPRFTKTTAELHRQKKVEAIRMKESYKGFQGNIGGRPKTSPALCHFRRQIQNRPPPSNADIKQLTSKNDRNFTSVNNQGIKHREYLGFGEPISPDHSEDFAISLATRLAMTHEVDGPSGYYSLLCQNNPAALRTLLSNKKYGWASNQYTGFNVRSYKQVPVRHVRFEDECVSPGRPQTAATDRQLLVPQPYIYRDSMYGNRSIRTAPAASSYKSLYDSPRRPASRLSGKNISFTEDVPDWLEQKSSVGGVRDEELSTPVGIENRLNDDNDTRDKDNTNNDSQSKPATETPRRNATPPEMNETPQRNATPPEINETPHSTRETYNPTSDNPVTDSIPHIIVTREDNSEMKSGDSINMIEHPTTETADLTTTSPKNESECNMTNINIAVESDEGFVPAEIDEVIEEQIDENQPPANTSPKPADLARRYSINDRINKMKMGEDLANIIMIEAEQRKKSLENLLEEHHQLVKSINSAENQPI